ncbi:788_t:CDS:2 [Entrophospora sp. SA101]|nr:788_t:CDS:2 [Entrophospora sp. SA101]
MNRNALRSPSISHEILTLVVLLRAVYQIEDDVNNISGSTIPNVLINEDIKAFETAFNFLEQNNLRVNQKVTAYIGHSFSCFNEFR